MKFRVVLLITCLFIAAACPSFGSEPCAQSRHLFFIANNSNPNVVYYDLCLDSSNNISANEPVNIYWVTVSGKTRGLNIIENKFGYGLSSIEKNGGNSVGFTVAALKTTPITVAMVNGTYRATINSEQGEIVIDKVYVNAASRVIGLPKVNYVDIIGHTTIGNKAATERITNDPKLKTSLDSGVEVSELPN